MMHPGFVKTMPTKGWSGREPFCWGVESNVIGGWLPPFTLIVCSE